MPEKLFLQWNDFKENVNSAFGRLRDDKEFTDVTLAFEDGEQMEAHRVILAISSPLFENILQRSKHPHPLIYLAGFKSEDMMAILDFVYFGEAKVDQENLDSFLTIAEELKLKGITGQTSSGAEKLLNRPQAEQKEPTAQRDVNNGDVFIFSDLYKRQRLTNTLETAFPDQIGGALQALEDKAKSMMERSKNTIKMENESRQNLPFAKCVETVAEKLKPMSLTGQTSSDVEKLLNKTQAEQKDVSNAPTTNTREIVSRELAIPDLEETVKSMMEKSDNVLIRALIQPNGKRKQTKAFVCKVCRKEGLSHHIKDHIEVYHLEGITIPCDNCENYFSTRHNLRNHKAKCTK